MPPYPDRRQGYAGHKRRLDPRHRAPCPADLSVDGRMAGSGSAAEFHALAQTWTASLCWA